MSDAVSRPAVLPAAHEASYGWLSSKATTLKFKALRNVDSRSGAHECTKKSKRPPTRSLTSTTCWLKPRSERRKAIGGSCHPIALRAVMAPDAGQHYALK